MIILTIDTAASLCAACVWDSDAGELGRSVLDLGKGHAEHLMAVIGEAMAQAGIDFKDIGAVAVSVGPGSFTGVRVGVAAARGLALALGVPAVGVSTLEALAAQARDDRPGRPVLALIEAGQQVYAAGFAGDGAATTGPAALGREDARAAVAAAGEETLLTGSAAPALAEAAGRAMTIAGGGGTADIAAFASLAARRIADPGSPPPERPKPLYLRDAGAKPQASFVLPRAGQP